MQHRMSIKTPEILWSGGNDNGKPNPVFSIDILPLTSCSGATLICTSGTDGSTPTKGSARIWKLLPNSDIPQILLDLNDHQSAVHTARFSPCGTMLATASDRMIILYTLPSASDWELTTEEKQIQRSWLRPHLQEIYDLRWSPDCKHIVAGSIDCKAEILRVDSKGSIDLLGHTSYVQGVAWDPLNQVVVSQSADRSCRTYQLRNMAAGGVKLSKGGSSTIKMSAPVSTPVAAVEGDDGQPTTAPAKSNHLFADDTVASFFRSQLTYPIASLAGLEDAAIAVRFSPVVYRRMSAGKPSTDNTTEVQKVPSAGYLEGDLRFIFAVTTTSTVFVYDTQHSHPLVRITGCHLATINDVTWSVDGNLLTCCSSDGYVTIVRFEPGSLGTSVDVSEIPNSIKFSHRCQYGLSLEDLVGQTSPMSKDDIKSDGGDLRDEEDGVINSGSTASAQGSVIDKSGTTPGKVARGTETESAKKRRRINPTPLGDIGPVVVSEAFRVDDTISSATPPSVIPTAATAGVGTTHSVTVSTVLDSNSAGSTAPAKKVKKRIAPMLVAPPAP